MSSSVRKTRRGCDRCHDQTVQARYRAMVDRWICDPCYPLAVQEAGGTVRFALPPAGTVDTPTQDDDGG